MTVAGSISRAARAGSGATEKHGQICIQGAAAKPLGRPQAIGVDVAQLETKTEIAGALGETPCRNGRNYARRLAGLRAPPEAATGEGTEHAVCGANADAIHLVLASAPVTVGIHATR